MPMGIAMALDLKLYLYVGVAPAVALGIITGALAGCLIGYCVDHVNGFGATPLGGLVGAFVGLFLAAIILYRDLYGVLIIASWLLAPEYADIEYVPTSVCSLASWLLGALPGALVGDYIERKLSAPDRANPIGVFIAMIIIIAALASGILSWETEPL